MAFQPYAEDMEEVSAAQFNPVASDMGEQTLQELQHQKTLPSRAMFEGAAQPGRALANLMASGLHKIPGIGGAFHQIPKSRTQVLSKYEEKDPRTSFYKGAGEMAPYFMGAGAIGLGAELLPELPSIASGAGAVARGLGKVGSSLYKAIPSAGVTGATSFLTSPENRAKEGLLGAAGGGVGDVAFQGASKVIPALAKSLGATKSVQEIKSSLSKIPGKIKLPLGDIIGSDKAQNFYKVLQGVFGSGANKPYEQVKTFASDAIKEAKLPEASSVGNVNESAMREWEEKYIPMKENTNKKYKDLGSLSDSLDLPFNSTNLDGAIDDAIGSVSNKLRSKSGKRQFGEMVKDLKSYKNDINDFSTAADHVSVLNQDIEDARTAKNSQAVRLYSKAKDGLEKSIERSALDHPEVYSAYKEAKSARISQGEMEKIGRKKLTPAYKSYLDGAISENLVKDYVKPGKGTSDYTDLTKALTDHISEQTGKEILSKNLDGKSISQQMSYISKFHPDQLYGLVGKDAGEKLHKISEMHKEFPGIIDKGFLPKTGMLGDQARQLLNIGQGGAAAYGLAEAEKNDSPSSLLYTLAPVLAAQMLQRGMRSPKLLNYYMKAVSNPSKKASEDLVRQIAASMASQAPGSFESSTQPGTMQLPDLDVRYEDMNQGGQ